MEKASKFLLSGLIFSTVVFLQGCGGDGDSEGTVAPTEAASCTICYELSTHPHSPDEGAYHLNVLFLGDMEQKVAHGTDTPAHITAIIEKLHSQYADNTLVLSAGDNDIPGPLYKAGGASAMKPALNTFYNSFFDLDTSSDLKYADLRNYDGAVDVAIANAMGIDASVLGNHEFDSGVGPLVDRIQHYPREEGLQNDRNVGCQFPYLSANLDFTAEEDLAYTSDLLDVTAFGKKPADAAAVTSKYAPYDGLNVIAPSATATVNGEKICLIGLTTPILSSITSPGGVVVSGDGGLPTRYPNTQEETNNVATALAAIAQTEVTKCQAAGASKIIMLDHLQQLDIDIAVAERMSGVQFILSGGSDSDLTNDPRVVTDKDGKNVVISGTPGACHTLGQLLLSFDADHNLVKVGYAGHLGNAETVSSLGADASSGNAQLVKTLMDAVVSEVLGPMDGEIHGYTTVYLEGRRDAIRKRETNLANLATDAHLANTMEAAPDMRPMVAMWNGGGIRAPMGTINSAGEPVITEAMTAAEDGYDKPAGAISTLDLQGVFRYNNGISICTTTAAGLQTILEYGVSASDGLRSPGQFPHVAGVVFEWDYSDCNADTDGVQRIRSMTVGDDTIISDCTLQGEATRAVYLVTNSFLVSCDGGCGDGFPFDTECSATAATPSTDANDEHSSLKKYLAANYGTPATAYSVADSPTNPQRNKGPTTPQA